MKMEPIVSSETSAIKSQTPGNYPKRNKLHLQHGESLRTRMFVIPLREHFKNKLVLDKLHTVQGVRLEYKMAKPY